MLLLIIFETSSSLPPDKQTGPTRRVLVVLGIALLAGTGCFDLGSGSPPRDVASGSDSSAPRTDASSGDSTAARAVETVEMADLRLIPETLEVKPGTAVVWKHRDGSTPHTLKAGTPDSPTGEWESSQLEGNDEYRRLFGEPGTHEYFCSQHPQAMQGVIKVVP